MIAYHSAKLLSCGSYFIAVVTITSVTAITVNTITFSTIGNICTLVNIGTRTSFSFKTFTAGLTHVTSFVVNTVLTVSTLVRTGRHAGGRDGDIKETISTA